MSELLTINLILNCHKFLQQIKIYQPFKSAREQHQFSLNNTHRTSGEEIMRILKMITRGNIHVVD